MFKRVVLPLFVLAALVAVYFWAALSWSYSSGERAGWVQKLSNKGWLCKTWEGELALVSLPGTTPEKFAFTIWDDAVAVEVTRAMGKRVSLHYEEKVGLPGSCFGEGDSARRRRRRADTCGIGRGLGGGSGGCRLRTAPLSAGSSEPGRPVRPQFEYQTTFLRMPTQLS